MDMTFAVQIRWYCGALLLGSLLALAEPPRNLIVDAGFESALPLEVERKSGHGNDFYAAKVPSESAWEGRQVLRYASWSARADQRPVLLEPFDLPVGAFSFVAHVRSVGRAGSFHLALFDQEGENLMDLAEVSIDGEAAWQRVERQLSWTGPERVRLGFFGAGEGARSRVELDGLAVVVGEVAPPAVSDNSAFFRVEAETLATGKAWTTTSHSSSYTTGNPASGDSDQQLLTGKLRLTDEENQPAVWPLTIVHPGPYRLWVRFHHVRYPSGFDLEVWQGEQLVGRMEIQEDAERYGKMWTYAWDSLIVTLEPGPVEVRLVRQPDNAGWGRRIDVLVLTNQLGYEPSIMDFREQVYMRWANLSEAGAPYCVWAWIRRRTTPWWGLPGIISRAGHNAGYYPPRDKALWLSPGDTSPWVPLSPYILDQGLNNVQLNVTRGTHTSGLVTDERLVARLDIAAGPERRILRSVEIDQIGSRFRLTVPGDIAANPDQIMTGWDWQQQGRKVVDRIIAEQGTPRPSIEHLNVAALVGLNPGQDEQRLFQAEVGILTDLGINNLYRAAAGIDRRELGLLPAVSSGGGLHYKRLDHCYLQPDLEAIRREIAERAEQHADELEQVATWKDADERALDRLSHIVACPVCTEAFGEYLRAQGVQLPPGVAPKPVDEDQRLDQPLLYYHTQRFRMTTYSQMARLCQELVNERFPNARCYNNISPPVTYASWLGSHAANDIYHFTRQGPDLCWSEDWRGYGIGPMHIGYLYSMMRVASRPQAKPMGMYIVVKDGAVSRLRTKLYQAVAGGATYLSLYAYGPNYATLDDWSDRYDRYPIIRQVLHEFDQVDDLLPTVRRAPAPVVVLYNRTAGIWEAPQGDNSSELDAQFLYWALVHAGQTVDVLPEEDVEAGLADHVKTVYVTGHWLKRRTAEALADWVRDGGTLVGTAGAGQRDEFNQPMTTLDDVFGVTAGTVERHQRAEKPRYNLAQLRLQGQAAVDGATLPQVAWTEKLAGVTGETTVRGRNEAGDPLLVRRQAGQGQAVRFAALPGLAYAWDAIQHDTSDDIVPTVFDAGLRGLIVEPAALAPTVAIVDQPMIELHRFDGDGVALLFLIDHRYTPTGQLTVSLPNPPGAAVTSAAGSQVEAVDLQGDHLQLRLNMAHSSDILIIR